jgi:hypothetical protein
LLAEKRLHWDGKQLLYDQQPLRHPLQLDAQRHD